MARWSAEGRRLMAHTLNSWLRKNGLFGNRGMGRNGGMAGLGVWEAWGVGGLAVGAWGLG